MKKVLNEWLLGCMVLCFSFIEAYPQSAELNYIDTRNYPDIKATFKLLDGSGIEIRNFSADDIVITENGKNRIPNLGYPFCSELAENMFSAIIVFDVSNSMQKGMLGENNPPAGSAKWEVAYRAIEHFIQALDPALTECAIIEFSQVARIRQWFTNNKDSLTKVVTEMPAFGLNTNYNAAFLRNIENVNNNLVADSTQSSLYIAKFAKFKPVIIFLTDGAHNPSNRNGDNGPFEGGAAIALARKNECHLFVIKIGNEPLSPINESHLNALAGVEGNVGDNLSMYVTDPVDLVAFYDQVLQVCSQFKYIAPCEVVWKSECSGGGNLQLNFPNHFNQVINSSFTIPENVKPYLEINPYKIYFQKENLSASDTSVIKLTARNNYIEFPQPGYVSSDQRFSIIDWGAKGNPPFTLEKDSSVTLTIRYAPTDLSHSFADILLEGSQCSGNQIVLDANNPNEVEEYSNSLKNSLIESVNPNPASGKTEVKYYLAEQTLVKIWITDILGHRLIEIENKISDSGEKSAFFNSGVLTDGIYFVVMQTPTGILKSKFIVIK